MNFKKKFFICYIYVGLCFFVFIYILYKEDYIYIVKYFCLVFRILKEKKSLNDKKYKKVYLDNEC